MKKQVLFSIISILILVGFTIEVCVIVQNERIKKAQYYASLRVTVPIMENASTTTKNSEGTLGEDDTFIVAPARVSLDEEDLNQANQTKRTTLKAKITGTTKNRYTTGPNKTVPPTTTTTRNNNGNSTTTQTYEEPGIDNITYSEENQTTYKYGTKITATSTYMIVTYTNGKVEKKLMSTRYSYDKSTFNGTSSQMKSEAKTMVSRNKSIINEVISKTNYYRTAIGETAVAYNEELSISATIRAMEMAYSGGIYDISHTRPSGKAWYTAITDLNYNYGPYLAENIAAGYSSAETVTNGWYKSEGHRNNMLNNKYKKIGVGYYELDGDKFWVQLFSN